jgi:hypothetical protein
MDVFKSMDHRPPQVISLAKKEELVYVQGVADPIRLKRNHVGLKLLQYLRDEAHRFAQHYHHILRRKTQLEEDVKQGRRAPRGKKKKSVQPSASSIEADLLTAPQPDQAPATALDAPQGEAAPGSESAHNP